MAEWIVHALARLREQTADWKQQGLRVGVVPTMGALHAGHLSLVEAARRDCDRVITTIFVNPTQFGPGEDLDRYPRTLERDAELVGDDGRTLIYAPAADSIYPPGFSTYIEPPAVARRWEGARRPGHFRGVTTVVLKLLLRTAADAAYFGAKDFQQAAVIRRMVADLDVPTEIRVEPTVRDPDGLALSSRNAYLSPRERERALGLSRALGTAADLVAAGERHVATIEAAMRGALEAVGVDEIDYAVVVDADSLEPASELPPEAVALIAARVGATWLIDNQRLRARPLHA